MTPLQRLKQPMMTLYADNSVFLQLDKLFDAAKAQVNVRLQTRFFFPALRVVERNLGICVMDPISAASYCSHARPRKIVFKPFKPRVAMRVGVVYPLHTPKSRITVAFAEQRRSRLSALERDPIPGATW